MQLTPFIGARGADHRVMNAKGIGRRGLGLLCLVLALSARPAFGGEIVHADGRREQAEGLRVDSKGEWTHDVGGRRVGLVPGEIVAVIDDAGTETVTIPALETTPDGPETAALLASIRDPKNEMWWQAAAELGKHPTQTKIDALIAWTQESKRDVRIRAVGALTALRTRESVMAAAQAVLAEKDAKARSDAASALFSAGEIFKRCDTKELVAAGLADKTSAVRYVFAMLAPPDLEEAKAVLRGSDGIKNSDHHVRESAAEELGERGDPAGESILISMLARSKLPGFDGDTEFMLRQLVAEQVRLCAILGKLGSDAGKAALKKAKSSPHEAVRKAAEAALGAGA